jgi:hypothetical protein
LKKKTSRDDELMSCYVTTYAVMPGAGFKNVYNHFLRRSDKVAGPTPPITRHMRFSTLAVLFTAVSATYALPLRPKARRDLLAILV